MLGPVLERLHDDLLEPLIGRVFQIMARAGQIPPPPFAGARWAAVAAGVCEPDAGAAGGLGALTPLPRRTGAPLPL